MKQLFILFMLFTTVLFSQNNITVVTTPELEDISTIEQTIVYYTKDIIEGSKNLTGSAIDIISNGVNTILQEGTIIVTQYLIFTSIKYGLLVALGIFLVFFLPKYFKVLTIHERTAELHNDALDDDILNQTQENWKNSSVVSDKYIKSAGKYFCNYHEAFIHHFLYFISFASGVLLILFNIVIFIKVTFFSKLYLAELVIKYLEIYV